MFLHDLAARWRFKSLAYPVLLCMGLFDELMSGFPTIALPLLRAHLNLSYVQIGLLFTAGSLSALIIEPAMNLLSDRGSKKPWILGGLLVLVLANILSALASSYLWLLLSFLLWFPATGAAVGLAEAALIDLLPGQEVQVMTRWTLLSGLGDLLSPLVVAAFVTLGPGWSGLCWLAVGIWGSLALLLLPLRFPGASEDQSEEDEGSEVRVWEGLRLALRDPQLLRWVALTLIPTMLDEIFLGFVALYLHDSLHCSEREVALILTLHQIAALLGLFCLDRVLKRRHLEPARTLFGLVLVTLAGLTCLFLWRELWPTVASLFLVSFSAAGWYPLAQAEAYARRPARSGLVRTVIGLGAPVEMALPGVVGLLAASSGLLAGLGLLGLAPILMLLLLPYREIFSGRRPLSTQLPEVRPQEQ